MANRALSADGAQASSGNEPENCPSRRSFLGAIAATTAIAGSLETAANAGSPTGEYQMNMHALIAAPSRSASVRWGWLRSNYERAHAAMSAFEQETYRPATDRFNDLTGPTPPTKVTLQSQSGSTAVFTVWQAHFYEGFASFEPVREARRAYDEHFKRVAQLEVSTGWNVISDEMQRLDGLEGQARQALLEEPAPDAQAFAFKVGLALEADELDDELREALRIEAKRHAKSAN